MLRLIAAGVLFLVGLLTWRLASPVLVNQRFANQLFQTEQTAVPGVEGAAAETRNIGFDAEVTTVAQDAAAPAGDRVRAVGANTGLPTNPAPATDPISYPEAAAPAAAQPANAPVRGAW
jgi:hypothetical protein